jgi:hypothetical protein
LNGATFHGRTLALIGPHVSAGDPEAVREGERRLKSPFPPSVREWYANIGGTAILQEFSNDDRSLEPQEFEIREIAGHPLVIFMTENQSVCWWAFALDSSDDPPVYVGYYGQSDAPLLQTRTFSDFVYSRVFDYAHFGDPDRYWMQEGRVPSAGNLTALRQIFSEEITTKEWTGTTAFRFSAPQGHLVIWVGVETATWIVSASSAQDRDLLLN